MPRNKIELPWFPLYPKDFFSSERFQVLTTEQVGAYFLLLLNQWVEGSIPNDEKTLAKLTRAGTGWEHLKDFILPFFVPSGTKDGARLINKKLERVRREQLDRHKLFVEAGKRGGRPPEKKKPG